MFPNFLMNEYEPCECCKSQLTNMTCTTGRKWTKKEVEGRVLYLAERVSTTSWWNGRSGLIDELKHWSSKLQKIKEVEEEFEL